MNLLWTTCPHCGKRNELHTAVGRFARPKPGDLSICWDCLRPAVFERGGVRQLTAEELAGPMGDTWRYVVITASEEDIERGRR